MSNIFKISDSWRKIIDMSDHMDEQTLDEFLESIEEPTKNRVANMIAVIKSIHGELETAEDYKVTIDAQIASMKQTISRLNDHIFKCISEEGEGEGLKRMEFTGKPWVKSVWLELDPPEVEIVDERLVDHEFKYPQPSIIDTAAILTRWKQLKEQYTEEELMELELIRGIAIKQSISVNYR